jgi:4-hydroxyphenylacetate 3-monooxygenase
MRTGQQYLSAIRDRREVYVDGRRVEDVTLDPAFAPIARTVASLYDLAADPGSGMTGARDDGKLVNRVYLAPRSMADLTALRQAIQTWARHTHGWVGRSPDHVAAFVSAMAAHPDSFRAEGQVHGPAGREFGRNISAFHEAMRDESKYVAYALIPPQSSRSAPDGAWSGDFIQAGVAQERSDGIVVRGAQMLATGAAVADELFLSCIKPLTPDDRDFAVSFGVPIATEGLRLYCRRPYATGATSGYDYPLTTRYDETDALVVFNDVFVPWERVFVYRDVAGLRRQFFDTGAHVLGNWQAQIRFMVKLQFIAGVARKVAAVNGSDKIPAVIDRLGELAGLVAQTESSVLAAEYTAAPDARGMWRPGSRALYGAMGLQAEVYPRVLAILRELAGGGVLQVPSSVADLRNPAIRADIDRYVRSPDTPAEERIKLFKLAWDITGSEFGGRHHQYEMFYAGAPFVARGYAFRNYRYEEAVADVDAFLAGYGADEPARGTDEG